MGTKVPLIPRQLLSKQQQEIYELHCWGLSNKEIAVRLNLEPGVVSTQLSRMRKKAEKLSFTYKIEPGAEHAQNSKHQDSPAEKLKKTIRDDPGFFKLMFNRYASDRAPRDENSYRLASSGLDLKLLFKARSRHYNILAATGKGLKVIKLKKEDQKLLGVFLNTKKISPVQIYWDDGTAVYLVTTNAVKKIKQLYEQYHDTRH